MATKGSNIQGIEKATGKSWEDWVKYLDHFGCREMTHKQIAAKVFDAGVPGWWAQSVTVAYEQHIGRRLPGQDSDGTFTVSVSKTVDGSMDEVLEGWEDMVKHCKDFDGVHIKGKPRLSKTDKYRNWRCDLVDGSRVVVGIYEKEPGKTVFPLAHEKLPTPEVGEHWRAYWKGLLGKL